MTGKPNFVFITTDQQRADHLGCYGNAIVKTPMIDSLAARGAMYENFYVACPICMPNRVAILTGRMPTVNGTRHNGIPLPTDAVTFVDVLRAGGYHTGIVGKSHIQNITGAPLDNADIFPRDHAGATPDDAFHTKRDGAEYEAELMPLWRDDPERDGPKLPYYGYDFVRFANGHSDHVQGHYNAWLNERHDDPAGLRGPKNALPAPGYDAPQTWRTAMPEDLYPTTYIAETATAFIDAHLDERADDPFFLHCSFTDPHHPFTPPGKYFDMYDPADMPLPPSFEVVGKDEPEFLQRLRREQVDGTAKVDGPLPFCVEPAHARQIIALTYGMISMVDDAIGRLLAHLDARGLAENTVVIFTSDHGDFMGDHGLMLKHGLHYQGVLRVPFIWADPADPRASNPTTIGSSIDIGAMVLGRAGLAVNNGNQGQDLNAIALGKTANRRKGVLIEEDELAAHLGTQTGLRTRTYIEDEWRVTLWEGMSGGQMFDRARDPNEVENLWNEPSHAVKKADLIEGMLRETIRLGDTAPYATHIA